MKNSMSRRQFILAAGALAGSAVLAGCGGSSTSGSSASTDSSSASTSSSDDSYTLVKDGTLTVVAELGFAPFEYMDDKTGDPEGFDVDVIKAALTGVQTGLYNAMVVDLPVAKYMLSNSFSDLDIIEEIPTGEQYGIAVSKDNPNLTKAINKALDDMKSDGTMDSIETKWFGSTI